MTVLMMGDENGSWNVNPFMFLSLFQGPLSYVKIDLYYVKD